MTYRSGVWLALSALSGLCAGPACAAFSPGTTARGLVRTKGTKVLPAKTELAMFAAGCFWGVEAEFRKQPGVVGTAVGFAGGHKKGVSYREVCSGQTGHAESVEVEYDPSRVSYEQLLTLFWDLHDPTTPNRQGPDVGEQYRSVIFFFSPEQRDAATASRDRLAQSGELHGRRIVTEIVPAADFWKAEEYHQQYVEKGGVAYCHRRKSGPI
jgi:peptide-methionine (S)-S-oxide reductase